MNNRTERGFTLLEVMVAMAIFAVAAMALLNAGRDQIQSSEHLEEKTFAHWVGMNWITELQLAGTLPDSGRGEKRVSMAGRDWRIVSNVENTPVSNVRRVTVDVSLAPRDFGEDTPVITSLVAYIGQNQSQNQSAGNASSSSTTSP